MFLIEPSPATNVTEQHAIQSCPNSLGLVPVVLWVGSGLLLLYSLILTCITIALWVNIMHAPICAWDFLVKCIFQRINMTFVLFRESQKSTRQMRRYMSTHFTKHKNNTSVSSFKRIDEHINELLLSFFDWCYL